MMDMHIPWDSVVVVLLLGAVFIWISWYISKSVVTTDAYTGGSKKLGVSFGAASLLAFWITGNTVMAAPESAIAYGILGAIGYGFLGGIAVILFAPIAKRIHQVLPDSKTVGDFFAKRYDKKNYYVFLVLLFVYVFGILMTQGIGGGLLLEQIFDIPYIVAVVLTFAIVIIYSMLGGFDSVTTIAFFQVILIVAVAIIAPILVYLNTGISPIYEGMLKLAPEKLDILLPAGLFFTFGVSMMAIGEVFMDNTFWQRAFAIDKNKIGRIFVLSGIGWAFVPVAVSTLAFVALGTNQMPENVNQVAPFIAKVYGGNFVAWLFLVCVWSALASTIAAVLNSLVSLFINDIYLKIRPNASNKSSLTTAKVVTVLIGLVGLLLSLPKLLTMLGMLMFLGVINAAYIFPIVFGLFWKKVSSNAAFAGATLAVIGGYIVYFTVGPIEGCVVSSFISFVATLAISLAKPANFDWETLKK